MGWDRRGEDRIGQDDGERPSHEHEQRHQHNVHASPSISPQRGSSAHIPRDFEPSPIVVGRNTNQSRGVPHGFLRPRSIN